MQWKKCSCAQFDENRLLHRAEQIADRPQPREGRAAGVLPRADRIRQIASNLRERHDCAHEGWWRKIDGEAICEACNGRLRAYVLECPHCLLRACARCKRNRL